MQKKRIWIFAVLLCLAVCLSACRTSEPVDNNIDNTTPTPTVGETATMTGGETPKETESATAGTSDATPDKTPTATPDATYNETADKTPTATRKPTTTAGSATAKPTQTATPSRYTQPYVLYVNREQNVVTVYTADEKGNAVTPIKVMLCSTGRNNGTPTGSFAITEKYTWRPLFGNVYGQYASRFNGSILFHSVPYLKTDKGTLKPGEYNKLGTQASDGCVRLAVQDCKWIYDNCGKGTRVVVYDSANPGPLGKPTGLIIPYDAGWDPTDPDKNNPWKQDIPLMPVTFSGVSSTTVEVQRNGNLPDLYAGVTATDSLGRDVTSYIKVTHTLNMSKTGIYSVSYQVTNQSSGASASATVRYQVVDRTAPVISGLTTTHRIAREDMDTLTREKLLQGISIADDGDRLDSSAVQLTLNGERYTPALLVAGQENRILLQVDDGNGNVTEKTITVIVEAETATPDATATPDVTETPEPTEPPEDTASPEPTATPEKTKRPIFTKTPIKT